MTRIKISAGIILLLIGASIFSGVWVNRSCDKLMELSTKSEELISAGKTEEAVEITRRLESEWEHFRKKAAVIVRSNKLSEIDRICARLRHLTEKESEEILSELTEMEHMLEMMKESETPELTSVF